MAAYPAQPYPAQPRRRRRGWTALLIVLLILAGLLLAADRGGAWAAQRAIADKVADQARAQGITSSGTPDVTIEGFPFLTQVARGRYDAISIRMREVSAQGLTAPKLDIRATSVRADASEMLGGGGRVVADRVTGDATVSFESVAKAMEMPKLKASGENGKLRLVVPIEIAGREFTVVAIAEVSAANGKVQARVVSARTDDADVPAVAEPVINSQARRLSGEIAIPKLPYGLTVTGVRVAGDGLVVSVSATNVLLSNG